MPLLELENIYKSYPMGKSGELLVLEDINEQVQSGELIALTGPSGAGKSTLLHIIGALDAPTKGKVLFDGIDIYKMKESELNKYRGNKMGFVFQSHYLLEDFTSLENVMIPIMVNGGAKTFAEERARKLIDEVGLTERLNHFPGELSGGEQQRIAVARALACSPKLVLADEPTGNLDKANSIGVIDLLSDLAAKGVCVIVVTHDEEIAERCHRIIRLEKK